MYVPEHFEETDEDALFSVIDASGLATLVSATGGVPAATLAPFVTSREDSGRRSVWGHLARANPQAQAVLEESRVLVVFRGPDAYVSPTWYADSSNVPTWNFVVVHAEGTARPVAPGDPRTRWILERTVAKYESRLPRPWRLDDAPDSYVEQLVPHVVAFELEVSTLRGQFKLSQNQPLESRRGVIRGLQQMPDDGSREIARLMAALEPRTRP
ncbi:MAG: FMN-binding negative transcriptional regulator [Actinobacteria bacterium]|nr:FMN-binding negative transcriptional regulator [Actinomycetota bacterium]